LFAALNGVRTVIVERADRISRDLMAGEIILAAFRKAGVAVIEAEDGRNISAEDPDNPTGTLIRQILAAVAQFDKTGIVSKLRKARERKRLETGRCEGVKPFGTLPGEQDAIERMRALRRKPIGKAKRMSFAKIAATLQAEGFKTRGGKPWQASSVRDILSKKGKT
jgi:DNA invertase Pin-like site-specific DNA recombinase